ncbi:MAG: Hsp20/alpha crystallin family protein [Candidatus Aenigmarchaeota archaeon]|nr:Hsp20/alpha crystallin family protein [Candidatus Aenigmarchaeota archaeon]
MARRPFKFFWEEDPWGSWENMMKDFMRSFSTFGPEFPVDVSETEDKIIVRADLPGINKKDVSVRIYENTLIIEAEQKESKVEEKENYFRQERRYGKFYREIPLPVEVDENRTTARMKDGVLTVEIPKKKKGKKKGKEITVR